MAFGTGVLSYYQHIKAQCRVTDLPAQSVGPHNSSPRPGLKSKDGIHGPYPWFKLFIPKTRVTTEHVWGVVVGHAVVNGVIHPCQTCYITHITLTKQWDSTYIHESLSLDHYNTDEVHDSSSLFRKPG